jgi:hypothetical protein
MNPASPFKAIPVWIQMLPELPPVATPVWITTAPVPATSFVAVQRPISPESPLADIPETS